MNPEDVDADTIRKWLDSHGAPFEMQVARAMIRKNLTVRQSHYYVDPEDERTNREVDVLASVGHSFSEKAELALFAVIECKYAVTPWIVYRTPPEHDRAERDLDRIATPDGRKLLDKLAGTARLDRITLWQREPNPGYALGTSMLNEQLERGGQKTKLTDDTAWKALHSATKASIALARELAGSKHRPQGSRQYAVIFPAIALRGRLFECWLRDDEIQIRETRRAQVRWSYPGSPTGSVLIDVLTETEIDGLADDAIIAARAMFEQTRDLAVDIEQSRPRGRVIPLE